MHTLSHAHAGRNTHRANMGVATQWSIRFDLVSEVGQVISHDY